MYGGEQFLRDNFALTKMERYFADVEQALKIAKEIGEKERQWILANQKITFEELLEDPPWGKDF